MTSVAVAARTGPPPPGPAAAAQPLLSVRGLAKAFRGRRVLHGVDLDVRPGEAVALIGANGAGKSTLLRCILRLIEPDGGDVRLLDQDVRRLGRGDLARLRAQVGFVFQRHNLTLRLSAMSNAVHGAMARGFGLRAWHQALAPAALRREALGALQQVGLADLALRRADRLSGGQSQRVAIARALMQQPRLMLADEPVASLDPAAGAEVMALFVDLMRRRGLTLLFTTHDLTHAVMYADRVIGLRDGAVALDAPARTLRAADLRAFYD